MVRDFWVPDRAELPLLLKKLWTSKYLDYCSMTRRVGGYIRIHGVAHIPTRLLQELRGRILVHLSYLRELGDLLFLRSCGGSWRHRVMLA